MKVKNANKIKFVFFHKFSSSVSKCIPIIDINLPPANAELIEWAFKVEVFGGSEFWADLK